MSGTEGAVAERSRQSAQRYGSVVVVGGGCYGSYYVRQLQRASRAAALVIDRLLVVDRDAGCRVAADMASGEHEAWPVPVEVVVSGWAEYFDGYLATASNRPLGDDLDAIVPSPLMPHLMGDWLLSRVTGRWPDRGITTVGLDRAPSVPWQRATPDGTHYLSFAEWICPINCIEPPLCPELGTPRTWTMVNRVRDYASAETARTGRLTLPLVLHCRHRAYGVGMFDTAEVIGAESAAMAAIEEGAVDLLIGTVSHCHGAVRRVCVEAELAMEAGVIVDRC